MTEEAILEHPIVQPAQVENNATREAEARRKVALDKRVAELSKDPNKQAPTLNFNRLTPYPYP